MAQSFDAKTIATGVEDANSLAILWTVGVNYTQGYFLQEPSATIAYDFSAP
ncbi:MAG: EAL domain-containing protein [Sedimenticola sp.]